MHFFLMMKILNDLLRASRNYNVRSEFTDFHFALMASITDE